LAKSNKTTQARQRTKFVDFGNGGLTNRQVSFVTGADAASEVAMTTRIKSALEKPL